jgi:hypothetical protein
MAAVATLTLNLPTTSRTASLFPVAETSEERVDGMGQLRRLLRRRQHRRPRARRAAVTAADPRTVLAAATRRVSASLGTPTYSAASRAVCASSARARAVTDRARMVGSSTTIASPAAASRRAMVGAAPDLLAGTATSPTMRASSCDMPKEVSYACDRPGCAGKTSAPTSLPHEPPGWAEVDVCWRRRRRHFVLCPECAERFVTALTGPSDMAEVIRSLPERSESSR